MLEATRSAYPQMPAVTRSLLPSTGPPSALPHCKATASIYIIATLTAALPYPVCSRKHPNHARQLWCPLHMQHPAVKRVHPPASSQAHQFPAVRRGHATLRQEIPRQGVMLRLSHRPVSCSPGHALQAHQLDRVCPAQPCSATPRAQKKCLHHTAAPYVTHPWAPDTRAPTMCARTQPSFHAPVLRGLLRHHLPCVRQHVGGQLPQRLALALGNLPGARGHVR